MIEKFIPASIVRPLPEIECHIVVVDGQLLCIGDSILHRALPVEATDVLATHYLGDLSGMPCGVHRVVKPPVSAQGYLSGLRALLGVLDEVQFALGGRALQVLRWDLDHQYCGRCAGITEYHPKDRARICQRCELSVYPRISPCVIMLVTRGEKCLLAHHRAHRHGMYTALAGFIEPGETAEQALVREVREEVGIEIGAVHYVGSQPWPFPGQLMLGFIAEWSAGALDPDGEEVVDAQWFHRNHLPETIPMEETLSGRLIRTFVRAE